MSKIKDRVEAVLTVCDVFAEAPGVNKGVAIAATLRCIQTNTGIKTDMLVEMLAKMWEMHGAAGPDEDDDEDEYYIPSSDDKKRSIN